MVKRKSEHKSTMCPKRLFILLCLAALVMWYFSKEDNLDDKKGVENTTEKVNVVKEKIDSKKKTDSKKKRKDKNNDNDEEYSPQSQNNKGSKYKPQSENEVEYIPQSQQ